MYYRRHGNTGRLPINAFSVDDTNRIISFIQNHAEANAILLPGRIPGMKKYTQTILPSSTSKRQIYVEYVKATGATTFRLASENAFYSLWRRYLPHIIRMKPMTDLCWVCQKNSTAIVRSARTSLESQSEVSSN